MRVSSSSSSSSTPSFDAKLGNSHNATNGCLSGIFRRLLCSGGLPTRPADHIKEPDCIESDHQQQQASKKAEAPTAAIPGIVARLMGLESLPELTWVPPGKTADLIGRSRSVNYAGYWPEFDLPRGRHRRVMTSLSFREAPTFLQLENEDFFLLSFQNVRETNEMRFKGRKSNKGFSELEQRKTEKKENNKENKRERVAEKRNKTKKEDQESRKRVYNEKKKVERKISDRRTLRKVRISDDIKIPVSTPPHKKDVYRKPKAVSNSKPGSQTKPNNHKEISEKAKFTKKKKSESATTPRKIETQCDSENTSPVSVLDLSDFLVDSGTPLSEEWKPRGSNSRRSLTPELAKSDCVSPPPLACIKSSDYWGSGPFEVKTEETRKNDDQGYLEWWGVISNLAEKEMRSSIWVSREMSKLEEVEEIGIEFGIQILDQLLCEIIFEFSRLL
uniref:DUF3741 domain-containing protein n=1 Tax=Nelumbo nucifera TaxID=4432 RepID=A0A822Y2B1_NELNU|nr:TPA_asm: hypothetical protein HUJ06_029502 [Nelumbo nucifera]